MHTLLIIGYIWPEPTATAAGGRMLQIIEQFKSLNYHITFASAAQQPTTAFHLNTLGVNTVSIALNDSSFDSFVADLQPSMVLFDRFMIEEQYGWRIAEVCPNAIRILDSEDLHFLRKARQQAVKKENTLPIGCIRSETAIREIASIYRCDVTLTISEFEMEYLQKHYQIPAYLLWYVPFMVSVFNGTTPSFEERKDLMFIGNFMHEPNWDAVLQLKNQIWPKLKKQLPAVKLHVYGSYPSQKVMQLHNQQERFYVHGRAKDAQQVMQHAKICLAPLRFGAGLKGKLIDAMQSNTPFVTSYIGAEGMFGAVDFSAVIANDAEDFVAKTVDLYQSKQLWELQTVKGKQVLKNRFKKEKWQPIFRAGLKKLQENYQNNRLQNFVGAMLQHHTLNSTKYLSKWIEEKNKF